MPGVLQVEALAQTMAVYVAKQPGFGDRIGLFAGIDDCRFKRVVVPGRHLRLEITMEKLGGRFGRGRGIASVDGEVACEATLSFIIPQRRRAPMTARVAVLSDVHGNAAALEAVRKAIRTEQARRRDRRRRPRRSTARSRPRRSTASASSRPTARSSSRATPTSPSPTSTTRRRSRG